MALTKREKATLKRLQAKQKSGKKKSKSSTKKRGRKKESAKSLKARGMRRDKSGKIRPIASRKRGRPAKSGVKRTPSGRISRATGRPRGRRKGTGKKAPKTITENGKRYRLSGNQGGHKSKKAALKAAPKMHRIKVYQGRYYVYTRGR